MYVVEYQGASGRRARVRDGDGREHPLREFKRRGDVQVFLFEPISLDPKEFKVTAFEHVKENYPRKSEALERMADEAKFDHAEHEELWAKSAKVKARSGGRLSRAWILKRLLEDSEYFEKLEQKDAVSRMKLKGKIAAISARRSLTGEDFLQHDEDAEADEDEHAGSVA